MIAAQNLGFRYADASANAFAGVNGSLAAGEFVAVRGPNSSGKTSLIRVLSGIAPRIYPGVVAGSGEVDRIPLPAAPGSALAERVGLLTDSPRTMLSGFKMTVRGELALPLENRGWPVTAIRKRLSEMLERFDLHALADRSPQTLSGGERQRLLLAAAMVHDPRVLLLDEPELHLDPEMVEVLFGILEEQCRHGVAVLCATHLPKSVKRPSGQVWQLGRNEVTPEIVPRFPAPHRVGQDEILRLEGVSFRYSSGPEVVKEADLIVSAGEAVALLGANGAGKTTLARVAIGLLRPTTGRVYVEGRDIDRVPVSEVANTIGLVFQDPTDQLFHSIVADELAFGPRLRGFTPERSRLAVHRASSLFGLSDLLSANPLDLSWSHRRLVASAAMLAAEPRLLILDEPTAGLDSQQQRIVGQAIRAWCAGGNAVLLITHNAEWAVRYCSRGVRMVDGRVTDADSWHHASANA